MKKLFIALVFVATGLVANAQLFIGGNIGFSSSNGSEEYITTIGNESETEIDYFDRVSDFVIAPTIGFMTSDAIGFGATIGFAKGTIKHCTDPAKVEFNNKESISAFTIAPFFRYVFGDFGKIKLYADAKLPLEFSSVKTQHEDEDKIVEEKGPKGFGIGFYIQPAFTYQFNEHISFNAELGLLSLGYSHVKTSHSIEEEIYGETYREEASIKENEFGFGVNTRVPVQFGFVYTF